MENRLRGLVPGLVVLAAAASAVWTGGAIAQVAGANSNHMGAILGIWAREGEPCPNQGNPDRGIITISPRRFVSQTSDCEIRSSRVSGPRTELSLACTNRANGNRWNQRQYLMQDPDGQLLIVDMQGRPLAVLRSCAASATASAPNPEPTVSSGTDTASVPGPTAGAVGPLPSIGAGKVSLGPTVTAQAAPQISAERGVPFEPPSRLQAPLAGKSGADQGAAGTIETVEVTGIGDTPDQARSDAARLAVQQVAGLYVDNRRRVELNISDQKYSEVVQDKILSYTSAYVNNIQIISAEKKNGLYELRARISVVTGRLVTALRENNIPTVAFDTNSAASAVETLAQEKENATQIYDDLLTRVDRLVRLEFGKPSVAPDIPSSSDSSWIRLPLTFAVNSDAVQEWRSKFRAMAQNQANLAMPVRIARTQAGDCEFAEVDMSFIFLEQRSFLRDRPGEGQVNANMCFTYAPSSAGVSVDCYGRAFNTGGAPWEQCAKGKPCLSFTRRASSIRMNVQFIDGSGDIVYELRIPFRNFPAIALSGSSRSRPPGSEKAFFDYCTGRQGPFFAVKPEGMYGANGDLVIFPLVRSRIMGTLYALLPNDTIKLIASIKGAIVNDAQNNALSGQH